MTRNAVNTELIEHSHFSNGSIKSRISKCSSAEKCPTEFKQVLKVVYILLQ